MIDAVRAEWIKFSTLVSSWVMVIIAAAFPLVIVVLTAALEEADPDGGDLAQLLTGTSVVSALLFGTLGVLSVTPEFTYNTIRPTFAALPERWRTLAAKPIVQVAVAATVLAGVLAVGWGAGSLIAGGDQELSDEGVLASFVGMVVLGALVSLLGYGLGLLVRNTALAICILLLWPLLVEGFVGGLLSVAFGEGFLRWLPYLAGLNLIAIDQDEDTLGRVPGGLWFALWVAAVVAFGVWTAKRRDA